MTGDIAKRPAMARYLSQYGPSRTARRRRARTYGTRRTYGRKTINQRTSGFVGASGDAKYVDVSSATYACDTTGSVTHMSIVPQGATVNQRDGKAFRCTSIQLRGKVTNGATAVANDCAVMLVWDKQPNKALAAVTDILDAATAQALSKRENASRFVTLRRFDFSLTGKSDGTSTPGYMRSFDKYVRLPPDCVAVCTTADTTGEIGNRVSGALLLVTVGGTAAGTAAASLIATARVNFTDV